MSKWRTSTNLLTRAYYREVLGFDLTSKANWTGQRRVACSQCQALVINNVPTHERGCPNDKAAGRKTLLMEGE